MTHFLIVALLFTVAMIVIGMCSRIGVKIFSKDSAKKHFDIRSSLFEFSLGEQTNKKKHFSSPTNSILILNT
jgi:hypothetical protein